MVLGLAIVAVATDWSGPEQQLARKIVAVTGPGAVALTVENRSSLGKRDSEIVQNGLRAALEGLGHSLCKGRAVRRPRLRFLFPRILRPMCGWRRFTRVQASRLWSWFLLPRPAGASRSP